MTQNNIKFLLWWNSEVLEKKSDEPENKTWLYTVLIEPKEKEPKEKLKRYSTFKFLTLKYLPVALFIYFFFPAYQFSVFSFMGAAAAILVSGLIAYLVSKRMEFRTIAFLILATFTALFLYFGRPVEMQLSFNFFFFDLLIVLILYRFLDDLLFKKLYIFQVGTGKYQWESERLQRPKIKRAILAIFAFSFLVFTTFAYFAEIERQKYYDAIKEKQHKYDTSPFALPLQLERKVYR